MGLLYTAIVTRHIDIAWIFYNLIEDTIIARYGTAKLPDTLVEIYTMFISAYLSNPDNITPEATELVMNITDLLPDPERTTYKNLVRSKTS